MRRWSGQDDTNEEVWFRAFDFALTQAEIANVRAAKLTGSRAAKF